MPKVKWKDNSNLLNVFFRTVSFSLAIYLIFRIFFLIWNYKAASFTEVIYSFYLGTRFDLRLLACQFIPLSLLFLLTDFRFKLLNFLVGIITAVFQVAIVIVYILDLGNYAYLSQRVNSAFILDDIIETETALEMAKDSYPIPLLVFAILLLIFLYYRFLRKNILKLSSMKRTIREKVIIFLTLGLCLYGNIGFKPLETYEAYFSHNRYLSQASLNPVINIFWTWADEKDMFPQITGEQYKPVIKKFLGSESLNRVIKSNGREKMNVMIVLLESLAANKTGLYNNKLDPTPELDKFAKEALVFTNFFTPGYKTSRGIWTMITGLPDVRSTRPRSRDLENLKQQTFFESFNGYKKLYFIGGHANWGNLDQFYKKSIPDLHLFQLKDTGKEAVDAWGISDEEFFEFSLEKLNNLDEPFVTILQTSGFHRPYTIPENSNYKPNEDISFFDLMNYGFNSIDEYNSLKLQDYSFGKFWKQFKKSKHYENTIVVVVGDHGLKSYKSINMPKGFTEHRLSLHHTPLLIHDPKSKMVGINGETIGSQVDVFPTAAHLAGIDIKTNSLGRNLFEQRSTDQNFAFIFSWDFRPSLFGVINEELYFESLNKEGELFLYRSESPLKDQSEKFKNKYLYMDVLSKAIYKYSLDASTSKL